MAWYLPKPTLELWQKQLGHSDEEFKEFLEKQNIEAYETPEAFELRTGLQAIVDVAPWTANRKKEDSWQTWMS